MEWGDFVIPIPTVTDLSRKTAWEGGKLIEHPGHALMFDMAYGFARLTFAWVDQSKNIFGIPRPDWAYDPKLPENLQRGEELYAGPRFERGHLVPKDDVEREPRDFAEEAVRATFYFSNATPQKPWFNQGAWKELEQWVGKTYHKFYVLTGPVLTGGCEVFRGVRIPPAFWKVVAFIKNGLLRTAAFLKAQNPAWLAAIKSEPEPVEEVPDQTLYQVPVRRIAQLADLNFEGLEEGDTLSTGLVNPMALWLPTQDAWRPIVEAAQIIL
ncbi:MAG: DNA/RNA non-specific endonuclease [Gammaproteobacteria bacterium]|nr:DNA/RNA non-specific endonuclease [Gammaproteobacteria bacterium]